MNDVNDSIMLIQIRPLIDVQRVKLDLIRWLQDKNHLKDSPHVGGTPNQELVFAFLFWKAAGRSQ